VSDEQNQTQSEPSQAASQNTAPEKAKTGNKGCVVAIIVVAVIVLLGVVGVYLGYRYVKSKINIDKDSSSITVGNTTVNSSTSGDTYATVTEQTITSTLGKEIDSTIKPILNKIYGDTKVKAWSSFDNDSGSIGYVTKNKVTNESISQIEPSLKSTGFSSTLSSVDQSGGVVSGILGDNTVYIYLDSSDNTNDITVAFSKSSTATDTPSSISDTEESE